MSPTPIHSTGAVSLPVGQAFLQRLVVLLLSSTLVLFLAGTALASIDGARPMVADGFGAGVWQPDELPDVAILLTDVEPGDVTLERLVVPSIRSLDGVSGVVIEYTSPRQIALFVSLSDDAIDTTVPAITTTIERALPDAQVALGGRTIADRDLLDTFNRGTIVAVVPIVILISVLLAASLGLRFGLAAGGTVALASLLGGLLGNRLAGPFDGSISSTAVPAVLVAVLVSSVLTFRLIDWFKHPQGDDQADSIRRAVRHLLPETALLFGGLIGTAIILDLLGSATAPTVVVAVGGIVAALVTLSVLPATLATLGAVPDPDEQRVVELDAPDGRDLPLAALAGFVCFLLFLGLFALRAPSTELADESALAPGVTSRRVSERLTELGGDPTSAILAELPGFVDPAGVAEWARTVSELPAVGWIETSTGRYEAGGLTAEAEAAALFVDDGSTLAIISPLVTPRSTAGQELVETIRQSSFSFAPELTGVSVEAAEAPSGAGHVWILVGLLAIAGALAVLVLLDDLVIAGLTFAIRLVGSAALLGIYHLIAGDATASELAVAALVVSVGVGLFEIGVLRRLRDDLRAAHMVDADRDSLVTNALRREGRAAMLGLGITALCGLGFLASDLEVTRQLGLAVAAAVVVELLIGIWILRPVMLGDRVVSAVASRRANRAAAVPVTAEETEWRRIVAGLLRAEFAFQTDPERAELETVFVDATPLFSELCEHNRRLRASGLRVAGEGPIVRRVSLVNDGSPVTLAITVDHPIRQLLDAHGRLLGTRPAERRDGMLWLVQDPSGRYRIAEAVDLSTGHPGSARIPAPRLKELATT